MDEYSSSSSSNSHMDDLQLTDTLQRYINDYYGYLDDDNSGKVPINNVTDLIKSGNVPDDVLNRVRK